MTPHPPYKGLTPTEVAESRNRFGSNRLTPPRRDSLWKMFRESFEDPVIRILLLAVLLSFGISIVLYLTEGVFEIAETIGILFAVLLATGISTWFVYDANRKFDVLNRINDDTSVRVIRDGSATEVPRQEIVTGDIVLLETGDEIPADGTLLESVSLQVNESTLTGEPLVEKSEDPARSDAAATYPTNRMMRGTTVADGHGVMEVTEVGDATEFGKVARKATELSDEETPLNRQLKRLAQLIGVVGTLVALLTFCILFVKGLFFNPHLQAPSLLRLWPLLSLLAAFATLAGNYWRSLVADGCTLLRRSAPGWARREFRHTGIWALGVLALMAGGGLLFGVRFWEASAWISLPAAKVVLNAFMAAVTLIVVAIPEGLPMSVTLSLALSMRKMLQSNNLVRKMHACETMGAATVICTDKTGTLTRNQMSVYRTDFPAFPDGVSPSGETWALIREGIAVNTTAHLDRNDLSAVKVLGNPTEGALLLWLSEKGVDYSPLREIPVREQLSFSTERKYMATVVDSGLLPGRRILYVKGAPEVLLARCTEVLTADGPVPVGRLQPRIEAQLAAYQGQAMRTLGFACAEISEDGSCFENGRLREIPLCLLGIAAISDPVRADVPEAVEGCRRAGIQVKIVTGDTPGTAREIGRQIGLWLPEDGEEAHISGPAFEALSDSEAYERAARIKIMSRARPGDKLRLVKLLQKRGEVVAVTGDGTNDAPALNHAHIGLSMGSGTSVAKEASDITLLDDSFRSILQAVLWGRSVYLNIQRFILFQLTINVAALLIVFFGSLLGTASPITVTQMLWINLIMDTFAAGALASLPPDPAVLGRPPRRAAAFIITPVMRRRILGVGIVFVAVLSALLWALGYYGGGIDPATPVGLKNRTLFFTFFVMLQFWNLFNAKTFGTTESAFRRLARSRGFLGVASLILLGQWVVVTWGGALFGTVPLAAGEWLLAVVVSSAVLWIGEIVRAVQRFRRPVC